MLMLENFDVKSQPVEMVIALAQVPQVDPRPRVLKSSRESVSATATQNSVRAEKSAITPAISRKIEKALEDSCVPSENPSYEEGKAVLAMLSPGAAIVAELKFRYGITRIGETHAIVIQPPKNGRINSLGIFGHQTLNIRREIFEYKPNPGFLGDDRVVFETSVNGQTFRLSYIVRVVQGGFDNACDDGDEEQEGD
jgi:hypothetical protein